MSARVVVVEAHAITRWGIGRLIGDQDGLEVVGEAAGPDAVRLAATLVPDVVLVGLAHPEEQGMALARELRHRFDDLGIVVLGSDDDVLLRAFEAGVSAFVSRSAPVVELVAAVRHAAVAASSFAAAGLAGALRRQREQARGGLDLSAREHEVLDLLVTGRSVPWIAEDLHISISTAKTYVGRLYDKLGVRTRAEAAMTAVRLGLVADVPHVVAASRARPLGTARPADPRPGGVIPVQASRSAEGDLLAGAAG
jgi:DNA-binding NarL/FixJ family response regulator